MTPTYTNLSAESQPENNLFPLDIAKLHRSNMVRTSALHLSPDPKLMERSVLANYPYVLLSSLVDCCQVSDMFHLILGGLLASLQHVSLHATNSLLDGQFWAQGCVHRVGLSRHTQNDAFCLLSINQQLCEPV